MDITKYIEINPKIMMGKPVIKGTRITVESLLEKLAAGETEEDILIAHPHLTKENIKDGITGNEVIKLYGNTEREYDQFLGK